jgi:hypothetical protein
MAKTAAISMEIVVTIIELLLSIASIMGLIYLTKFSFKATVKPFANGKLTCVEGLDQNKMTFAKIATVLLWIQIGFSVLGAIMSIAISMMTGKNSKSVTGPVSAFMAMRTYDA